MDPKHQISIGKINSSQTNTKINPSSILVKAIVYFQVFRDLERRCLQVVISEWEINARIIGYDDADT